MKALFNVAVFENSVPNAVRAGLFVQNAAIGKRLLRIDHRFQRFVLDLHEFRGIVGQAWRLRDHRGDRLALVKHLGHGHRIVPNFLRVLGADFDEGLGLCGNLSAGERAYHARQRLGG